MSELMPYIVAGIATGAIYGLTATGLVLTYKTSGIFNFAHGAIAAAAAYFFYFLHIDHEWNWLPALLVSVVGLGAALGLLFEVLARHLAPQRTAMKIVGSVGLILVVQGLATIKYNSKILRVPQYLPGGVKTFRVGGVNISYTQLIITCVAVCAVAALYGLFQFARIGVTMRAVVDDPDLLSLHSTSPSHVRRWAWLIGSTFAALSGVLVAPSVGVEAIGLTYLVVQAYGAAAMGYFSSIPLTFGGGILLGILASLSTKWVINIDWLRGLPASLPFLVLFLVLIVMPKRKLAVHRRTERRAPLQWHAPARVRAASAVVVVGVLMLVPQLVDTKLAVFTVGLTQAIMLLSLGLLVRTAGLVSLGHATFAGIGAVAFAQFVENFDLPWIAALLLGSLVVVPIAALLALPAIRLSGLYLALATFGFGLMIERMFYSRSFMFTSFGDGRKMPRPSFAEGDKAYYFLVLACLVLVAACMEAIHMGRLGRLLRGLGDSPTSVQTMGLSINLTRLIVFCISGFFAGASGILYGSAVNVAQFGDSHYTSFQSLILLAILALAPFREPWYAVFAVISAVVPGYWTSTHAVPWLNVLFGFFAIVTALQGGPPVMPTRFRTFFERFARPIVLDTSNEEPIGNDSRAVPNPIRASGVPGLEVQGLHVRFGGHAAVDDLSLTAEMGRITGLLGPNGAGKTTTFNACSGLLRPSSGQVLLHGVDVSAAGPSRRGRSGLGRTFQITQLCDSLTVAENVALGRETAIAGARVFGQLAGSPGERALIRQMSDEAMELCGIGSIRGLQAGALSTGQRRLVELARCLAGPFDVLLLDEPSSGLDHDETRKFGETLQSIVEERGCAVLLVEHDIALVMRVCQYMYVLDFGRLLFEGTPDEVAASTVVQTAYLGSSAKGPGTTKACS